MYFVLESAEKSCTDTNEGEAYKVYLNPTGILLDHEEIEKGEITVDKMFVRYFWTKRDKGGNLQFWKISNF